MLAGPGLEPMTFQFQFPLLKRTIKFSWSYVNVNYYSITKLLIDRSWKYSFCATIYKLNKHLLFYQLLIFCPRLLFFNWEFCLFLFSHYTLYTVNVWLLLRSHIALSQKTNNYLTQSTHVRWHCRLAVCLLVLPIGVAGGFFFSTALIFCRNLSRI